MVQYCSSIDIVLQIQVNKVDSSNQLEKTSLHAWFNLNTYEINTRMTSSFHSNHYQRIYLLKDTIFISFNKDLYMK